MKKIFQTTFGNIVFDIPTSKILFQLNFYTFFIDCHRAFISNYSTYVIITLKTVFVLTGKMDFITFIRIQSELGLSIG